MCSNHRSITVKSYANNCYNFTPVHTVITALSLRRKCNILSRTVSSSFSSIVLFKKINIKQQREMSEEDEYWGKK